MKVRNLETKPSPGGQRAAIGLILVLATVLLLPGPDAWPRIERGWPALVQLMEKDYVSPLFSSASVIDRLNQQAGTVGCFAGYDDFKALLSVRGQIELAGVTRYAGKVFPLLQVEFLARASESGEPKIFLSERFWRRVYAADLSVVGETLRIHDQPYRIAGITRTVSGALDNTDIWMPLPTGGFYASMASLKVIGMLRDAAGWKETERAMARALRAAGQQEFASDGAGTRLVPLERSLSMDSSASPLVAQIHSLNQRRRAPSVPMI